MITQITFDEILPIWQNHLWPERISKIESHSSMNFLSGYDLRNMESIPTFLAYIEDKQIKGVNSGHMCHNNSYRSRGLWVFPEHRKQGIGVKLLVASIEQAALENASSVWSYPKQTSWNTYAAAKFTLASDWEQSELGLNAYCILNLN